MGGTYTSGSSTINGDVAVTAIPSLSTGQTQINVTAYNQADEATIYTVTAAKTFYCLGLLLGVSTSSRVAIKGDGGTIVIQNRISNANAVLLSGGVVFKASAGTAIKIDHDIGAAEGHVSMWGYEE